MEQFCGMANNVDPDQTAPCSLWGCNVCSCSKVLTYQLLVLYLTLKVPITTAADDIHKYFFIVTFFFSEKIRLDVSSEELHCCFTSTVNI